MLRDDVQLISVDDLVEPEHVFNEHIDAKSRDRAVPPSTPRVSG